MPDLKGGLKLNLRGREEMESKYSVSQLSRMEGMEEVRLQKDEKEEEGGWFTSRLPRKVPKLLPTGGGLMAIASTSIKKGERRGWRDGSGEMATGCSCRRPGLVFLAPIW